MAGRWPHQHLPCNRTTIANSRMTMSNNKPLVEHSFNDLVEEATRDIHNALLEDGGKGMKRAVFTWLSTTAQWRDLRKEKQS